MPDLVDQAFGTAELGPPGTFGIDHPLPTFALTELPIRISGAQFDDWATSKNNRRSCAARRSSGSGVPDDSLGTAVRVRRAAEVISGRSREDAVGRSQEAEGDNDVGFVLNRLRNVYKH